LIVICVTGWHDRSSKAAVHLLAKPPTGFSTSL